MIELLQDDKLRSVINPGYDQESHSPQNGHPEEANVDQFDDEEEMIEMMAMQEECRLEMMKFYIQSQNPKLFEEVYHGVSYPDEAPQRQAETYGDAAPTYPDVTAYQAEQPPTTTTTTTTSASSESSSSNSSTNSVSLKDLIVNDLNKNATDFDPAQLANLNLNEQN